LSLLDNTSQIVLRQRALLLDDLLLVCPPTDNLASEIKRYSHTTNIKVLSWDYDGYQLVRNQAESLFSLNLPESWQARHIVLFMPKARKVLPLMFAVLGDRLRTTQKIWLVGEKRGGVESTAKSLAKTAKTRKIDSARHCQLWDISFVKPTATDIEALWQQSVVKLPKVGDIKICCLPGVFSSGRLDSGTELLLSSLPDFNDLNNGRASRFLDFGCGYGVVGLYLRLLYPRLQVELADVSLLALESASKTGQQANIELTVLPSSGLSGVKPGLSAIVSNPPFHQGIKKDTRTTEKFLKDCSYYLNKGGSLTLVANRFLPYQNWIKRYIGQVEVLAENTQFKVYHAVNS